MHLSQFFETATMYNTLHIFCIFSERHSRVFTLFSCLHIIFQRNHELWLSSGFEEPFPAADLLTSKEPVKAAHCL